MTQTESRLARERTTMARMVDMYCRAHHGQRDRLPCDACRSLLDYAEIRLDKCPYGKAKPTCANCPIHCYKPERREQVRAVMRFAGPRMLLRHPWLAITHMLGGMRKARHPKALTRDQRMRSRRG